MFYTPSLYLDMEGFNTEAGPGKRLFLPVLNASQSHALGFSRCGHSPLFAPDKKDIPVGIVLFCSASSKLLICCQHDTCMRRP